MSLISQVSASDLNSTDDNLVNQQNDEIVAATYAPKNFTDLKSSIEAADDGDTIELNGTYTFDEAITVNKKLTIIGSDDGAILKDDGFAFTSFRFFDIQSSQVVLKNLKLNGHSIRMAGDNCSIINCEFKSITTDDNGPLFITGENCNVTDSKFLQNKAKNGGGAINVQGKTTLISNCEFSDNEDRGNNGAGGAIIILADECIVDNCIFALNYCTGYGGAIAVYSNGNKITNSKFKGNYVSGNLTDCQGGGAIFSFGGLNINNCSFEENHANNALGGAIILGENNLVNDSFFNANMARFGNDIYANSTAYVLSNNFILDYKESHQQAINGSEIIELNNDFKITKMDSSVKFISGMVFEYGSSGKIQILVDGGVVKQEDIRVLNHKEANIDLNGNILTVWGLAVGTYTLRVTTTPDDDHNSKDEDLSITVKKAVAYIKTSSRTVALKKGYKWTLTFADSRTNKPISNMKVTLNVYTGKKYKTVKLTTNSKGSVTYQTKKLSKGNHKVKISASHSGYSFNSMSTSLKVVKQKSISITSVVNNAKDGSTLTISVKDKKTKNALNGVKLKLLVYTGKKYKIITLKTKNVKNFKGMTKYATNQLSVGKHKVKILSDDIRFSGSGSTKMIIKKSAKSKKYGSWTHLTTA